MRLGYDRLRTGLARYSKQIMVVSSLMALPMTVQFEKIVQAKPAEPVKPAPPAKLPQPAPATPDPRAVRLTKFFASLHCPVAYLASDFVHAADDNHLDWRLLPSISIIESGGGKAYKNNNIFGWNKGEEPFPTIRSGLNEVAFKLGKSPLYRNRDVMGKLRLYNPDDSYPNSVISLMNRISPVVDLKPAHRLIRRPNEFVYQTD